MGFPFGCSPHSSRDPPLKESFPWSSILLLWVLGQGLDWNYRRRSGNVGSTSTRRDHMVAKWTWESKSSQLSSSFHLLRQPIWRSLISVSYTSPRLQSASRFVLCTQERLDSINLLEPGPGLVGKNARVWHGAFSVWVSLNFCPSASCPRCPNCTLRRDNRAWRTRSEWSRVFAADGEPSVVCIDRFSSSGCLADFLSAAI